LFTLAPQDDVTGTRETGWLEVLASYGCAVASYQPLEDLYGLTVVLGRGTESGATRSQLNAVISE
jgi:hypothetical protein